MILSYISDLISGLKYLQRNGIILRKLQPDYIFLSNYQNLVIGGLEMSIENNNKEKVIDDDNNYAAPEILVENSVKYTEESVIYSLGCVIYELYTLNIANKGSNRIESKMMNKIEFNRYKLPRINLIEELIVKMINNIPMNRIKLKEIDDILNSFKNDFTSIKSKIKTEPPQIKIINEDRDSHFCEINKDIIHKTSYQNNIIKEVTEKNEYEKEEIKDFDVFFFMLIFNQ